MVSDRHCFMEVDKEDDSKAVLDLSDELVAYVLSFVPPLDLLRSASLTCARFSALLRDDNFWKRSQSCNEMLRMKHGDYSFTTHQLQRYALYNAAAAGVNEEALDILQHDTVLPTYETVRNLKQKGRSTCAASTTDRPSEAVENILTSLRAPSVFHRFLRTWWSSTPTIQPDARNEVLMFATKYPTSLMTEVHLQPLRDPYIGHVVYSWKLTKIRAYLLRHNESKLSLGYPCTLACHTEDLPGRRPILRTRDPIPQSYTDARTIRNLLKGEVPVYESDVFPVMNPYSDDVITYNFPAGGVVANVFTVELIGKHAEQTTESGYYACVEKIDCRGIDLPSSDPLK